MSHDHPCTEHTRRYKHTSIHHEFLVNVIAGNADCDGDDDDCRQYNDGDDDDIDQYGFIGDNNDALADGSGKHDGDK